jgi:hypothetical protein
MVIDEDTRNIPSRERNNKMLIIRPEVIQVQVKLPTALAKYSPNVRPGVPFISEIPDRSTVSDLITYLAIPETEVSIIFVNGFQRSAEFQLKNEDAVSLFPVAGSWVI